MRELFFAVSTIATIAFAGSALAAECNLELKPTDGYKELSEKLKCLSATITSQQVPGGGTVKLIPGEPVEMNGCVQSSSLPPFSTIFLRLNGKLCRDDGSVWMRITHADTAYSHISIVLPDEAAKLECNESDPSCSFGDRESKQSFRLQIERRKDGKGNVAWVGMLRKLATE